MRISEYNHKLKYNNDTMHFAPTVHRNTKNVGYVSMFMLEVCVVYVSYSKAMSASSFLCVCAAFSCDSAFDNLIIKKRCTSSLSSRGCFCGLPMVNFGLRVTLEAQNANRDRYLVSVEHFFFTKTLFLARINFAYKREIRHMCNLALD